MRLRHTLYAGLVALLPLGAMAQTDPAALQTAAITALQEGDLAAAASYAQALVALDPGDPVGRGILARVALMQGQPAEARDQAVALWHYNDDQIVRYDAARLAAFSWVEMDWPIFGQYWLRRALTVAPDDAAAAETINDFRNLRAANPLKLDLAMAVTPSANVTNGTTAREIRINGETLGFYLGDTFLPLAPSYIDRAYGGIAYAPRLSVSYRLREDADSVTNAWAMLQYRGVILSDAARRELDGAEYNGQQISDRHFSFGQVLTGLDHQWRWAASDLTLSGHVGRNWSRGAQGDNLVNLGLSYTLYAGETASTTLAYSREWRLDTQGNDPDETRNTLRLSHVRFLDNGSRVSASVGVTQALSAATETAFDRLSLDLGFRPPEMISGVTLDGRLSYSWTNYPDYSFFEPIDGGRTDESFAVGVDARLQRFSYAGFSPVISLEARRTLSNVNQFANDELLLDIGFESSF